MLLLSAGHSPITSSTENEVARHWVYMLASSFACLRRSVQIVPVGDNAERVRWVNECTLNSDLAIEVCVSVGKGNNVVSFNKESERAGRFAEAVALRWSGASLVIAITEEQETAPEGKLKANFLRDCVCTSLMLAPSDVLIYNTGAVAQQAVCDDIAAAVARALDEEVADA